MSIDLRNMVLYVDPNSLAAQQARKDKDSNPVRSRMMQQLADVPAAIWLGVWTSDPTGTVDRYLTAAAGKLVVFVVYAAPALDLGGYSAGGAAGEGPYKAIVDKFMAGVKGRPCIFVCEPDGLPHARRMSEPGKSERLRCIAYLVDKAKEAGALAAVDVGDSGWVTNIDEMVDLAVRAGVLRAWGTISNVSHYRTMKNEHAFNQTVLARIRERHGVSLKYLIDSSRCGRGPYTVRPGEESDIGWANAPNAGYGPRPNLRPVASVYPNCAGWIWCKGPIASDGEREGAPEAGKAYPQNAVRMWYLANPKFPSV